MRETVEPTKDERGDEQHPAWGLIGASRWSGGNAVLFDSDIRHNNTVTVTLHTASRQRDLSHDYIHPEQRVIQVQMSEAQWASFVSSMGGGNGVPCTIRFREGADEPIVPEMPHDPRLRESMEEVRTASTKAIEEIQAAFDAYDEKRNKANRDRLKYAIKNAPSNMSFAAKSLSEHAENVVQRARADVEAMVLAKAEQLGLEPGEILDGPGLLDSGD